MTDDDDVNRAELQRLADIAARSGDTRTAGLARDVARRVADPDFNPWDVGDGLKRARESAENAVKKGEEELLGEWKRHTDLEMLEDLASKFDKCGDTAVARQLRIAIEGAKGASLADYRRIVDPAIGLAKQAAGSAEAERTRGFAVGQRLASMKH